ncbi:hypothetical protein M0R01_04480 [bacterium]|jgi:hypothetical protein|nr:hypothetical protein [bacterium]
MYDLVKLAKKEMEKKKEKSLEMTTDKIWPSRIDLPYISFNAKQLPEIKDWEVGKEYEMKIKIKMNSYSESKALEGNEVARADFDLIGVEPIE